MGTYGKRVRRVDKLCRISSRLFCGLLLVMVCFCLGAAGIMAAKEDSATPEAEVAGAAETSYTFPVICIAPPPELEAVEVEVFEFREDIPLSEELQKTLWDACQEHEIEYALALGVMEQESHFDPWAQSDAGCYGLMQLNVEYFPTDLSPAENIRYGVECLADKLDRYDGDVEAALTAYNAGYDTGKRGYARAVLALAERWRAE